MAPKPFAVGLRIEHPREMIDRAQYGQAFGHPRLGAAEYTLKSRFGERGVYTFCMCPGGEVICSATEPGGLAVNGMSYYARSGENSNSALVVSVGIEDFEPGPLGGLRFAQRWEAAAYREGFAAPVQTTGDFLAGACFRALGGGTPHVQSGHGICRPARMSAGFRIGGHRGGTARLWYEAQRL